MNKLKYTIPIFFNSKDGYKNSLGNESSYQLNPSILLDPNNNNYYEMLSATVVYNTSNLSASKLNNTFTFDDGVLHTYIFPDGLYSLADIQETLSENLVNDGLPSNLFILSGDSSTQKTSLQINAVGVSIDVSTNTLLNKLLSFTSNIGPTVLSDGWYESNDVAKLNSLLEYQVRCNFTNGSYFNKNGLTNIVDVIVPFNAQVGSQIFREPINPIYNKISVSTIDEISFRITDQNGDDIDTRGEEFNVNGQIVVFANE